MAAVTRADVILWGGLPTPASGSAEEALLDKVLAAVVAHIQRFYVVPADVTTWDDDIQIAVMLQTVRLWKRRQTPEGLLEFDELGAVRVSSLDGDVEKLLGPLQAWGCA